MFLFNIDGIITLNKNELAMGVWLDREEIPLADLNISLKSEMMEAFRTGNADLI